MLAERPPGDVTIVRTRRPDLPSHEDTPAAICGYHALLARM
jgi:hypothetical protein